MAKSDLVLRIDQKRDYGVSAASTVYYLNNSNAFFAELSAITADMGTLNAGSIVIGTANKLWLNDSADGGLAVGGIVKEDAPFRVSETGQLVATDVRITAGNGVEINEDGLRIGGAEASALWGGEIKTAGGVGTGVHGLRWYDIYGVPRVSILTLKPGTNAPYFRLGGPTDPEWLQWDATGLALSGTITALAGNIGGWTIATGLLHAGENTSYVGMQPGVYPFFAGASNPALANFRVNSQGVLYAADAVIAGDITAISGRIEGLLRIGTDAAVNIRLDGYNARLESSNFVAGVSGWRIDASGSAEFENITARGAIRTAVFEKSLVTAFAGSQIVAKSAAVLYEAFVAQSGTVLKVRPQAGAAPFALNDLIHLKDAVGVIWLRCDDNGTLTGTDHYVYAVTKMNGTAVTTYQVGHAAVDYGQSGQGYWIVSADGMLGASAAWALRSHAGEPWNIETTHVYAGTDGKLYAGGGDVVLDNAGISILAGTDATNELKFVSDTGSPLGTLYAGPDSENPSLVLASARYLYLSAMQTQITSQDGIDFLGPLYINRYTPIYDVTVASSGEPQMLFVDASEDKVGIATAAPTLLFSVAEKVGLTPDGGLAVLVVAGENLVRGEVVYARLAGGADGKVWKTIYTDGESIQMPTGFVYADASANANVWVVTSGIAYALPESGVTAARGNVAFVSNAESGRLEQSATVPTTEHWRECGHFLDTGSGAGVLTRLFIHFN